MITKIYRITSLSSLVLAILFLLNLLSINDVSVNGITSIDYTVHTAHAQSSLPEYKEDGSGGFVPCGNTVDNPCNISHLFRAFVVIVNYMVTMAGFVAVASIVYGGILMASSNGVEKQITKGRAQVSGSVIGLALVAVAFVLVNSLFSGSLSVGVRDGGLILTKPLEYIQKGSNSSGSTTSTQQNTTTTTSAPKTTNSNTKTK